MAGTAVLFSMRKYMAENVTLHVRVKGLRFAAFRLRLAIPFVWLAAKVAGTGFSVDVEA